MWKLILVSDLAYMHLVHFRPNIFIISLPAPFHFYQMSTRFQNRSKWGGFIVPFACFWWLNDIVADFIVCSFKDQTVWPEYLQGFPPCQIFLSSPKWKYSSFSDHLFSMLNHLIISIITLSQNIPLDVNTEKGCVDFHAPTCASFNAWTLRNSLNILMGNMLPLFFSSQKWIYHGMIES